jgi:hypothetical protein
VSDRLAWAFDCVLSRPARPNETEVLSELFARESRKYAANREAANKLLAVGAHKRREGIDSAELAAWVSVARVLLNLHETITRY